MFTKPEVKSTTVQNFGMNECHKNKRNRAQLGWLVILLRLYICSSKEMETRRMGRQK